MTVERKVDLFRTKEIEDRNGEVQEREEVFARLVLPENVELVAQRWTQEGWSGSFTYFGEDGERFVLRERSSGTIECEFHPFNRVSGKLMKEKRRRTRETDIGKALTAAIRMFIHKEHERRVVTGPVRDAHEFENSQPHAVSDPTVEECAILIRALGKLHKDKKQRGHEEKVLDFFTVVWGNKKLSHLSDSDVEDVYEIRKAGFKWPARFKDRRPLKPNPRPITVQFYLETLRTLLNRLKGENRKGTGEPYLSFNRLDDLKLGQHSKAQRPDAHPHRYSWVFAYADESVEIVREEGLDRSYLEVDDETGELVRRPMRRYLPDVIPGITRGMLVLQYGHGMRPGSWRHIRVDQDVAVDVDGVCDLIGSLRLEDHDEKIKIEWADVWQWGAVVYRKEFLKGKANHRYERIVPHSEQLHQEFRLYLQRREEWLAQLGVSSPWLFPSPTDPRKPISDEDARELLYAAEALAREKAVEARGAKYAKTVLKDLNHTAWYAYRRTWKTLRNARGWHNNKNCNYVGGWSTKVGQISEVVYARLLPEFMLAVVEGLSVVEAVKRYGETDELNMAIDISPDGLPGE